MIPAEAVEAAAKVLDPQTMSSGGALAEKFKEQAREEARRILEAAAPHMRPVITSMAGLRALPGGSIVLDAEEYPAEKLYRNTRWWHQMGTHDGVNIADIKLPAKVLWEPADE